MGTIARFRFSPELLSSYPTFVETGTGRAAGVEAALKAGFASVYTVDSEAEVTLRARERFKACANVHCEHGDSAAFLNVLLHSTPRNEGVVLWLDAHFPGSDVLGIPYDSEGDRERRLPLERELRAVRLFHPRAIVIIDDLRLYHAGPFAAGNVDEDHVGLTADERREAARNVYAELQATHDLRAHYGEEGYLLLVPRNEKQWPEYVELGWREHCELARTCVEVDDDYGATGHYRAVVQLTEGPLTTGQRVARAEACRWFAEVAHFNSEMGTECDWYYKCLNAAPWLVEHRLDFVNRSLLPLQMLELARTESEKATRIAPDQPRTWQTRANVEREAGDAVKAEEFALKALEVGPDNPGSHLVAAQLYADTARFDEALDHYDRVLAMPNARHRRAEAIHGVGIVHDRLGNTERALQCLDEAIEAGGGDQTLIRWNRSEMLLTLGRYEEGWRDHIIRFDDAYRGRELAAFGRLGRRFKVPFWRRNDPPCRLHVHQEMGFGDVICMARYVPLLAEMGHDVRFEVATPLVSLFKTSLPEVKVQEFAIDYPGAFGLDELDEHVTTMAFPHLFGTTTGNAPWSGPYLRADPAKVDAWFVGIPALHDPRLKVGLCWSAGIRPGLWYERYGKRKSMRFDELEPLLSVDASFVSLQAGPERLENTTLPGLGGEKPDWSDTAAVVANLDVVVTVDTAVAHLAGAMGKPVILMMHTQGSWHWMRSRLDSPWYPSVRIVRQERPHEWGPVVEEVKKRLLQAL